jgi:hypothetical protein
MDRPLPDPSTISSLTTRRFDLPAKLTTNSFGLPIDSESLNDAKITPGRANTVGRNGFIQMGLFYLAPKTTFVGDCLKTGKNVSDRMDPNFLTDIL